MTPLVRGDPPGLPVQGNDPWRDEADGRVGEVVEQLAGKVPAERRAVGVEERDHRRRTANSRPGVAGRGRTAVAEMADVASAEPGGHCGDRPAVGRAVVDHDHRRLTGQRRQAQREPLGVAIHRHDDRHLLGWATVAGRRLGLGQAGVEQTASEQTLCEVVPDRLARPPSLDKLRAAPPDSAISPRWRTPEQHLAAARRRPQPSGMKPQAATATGTGTGGCAA